MSWLLLAIGLVMIVEGLAYALAPGILEQALEILRGLPRAAVRLGGLLAVVLGVICVLAARHLGIG